MRRLPLLLAALAAAGPAAAAGSGPAADEADRRARVAAVARATDPAALAATLKGDLDPLVRAAAAEALGRRRALSAVPPPEAAPLAGALAGDPDPGVRQESARALAALVRRIEPPVFARAATEYLPDDAHIRRDHPAGLPPEAVSALGRAAGDPDREVRVAAIRALGEIGPKAAAAWQGVAEQLARGSDARLRGAAAQALGRLGESRATPALARALDDPATEVRLAAAAALRRLASGNPPPAELVRAARDRDGGVRAAALEALVEHERRSSDWRVPGSLLVAALDDESEAARAAAADGLAQTVVRPVDPGQARRLDLDRRIARESGPSARAALHALAAALRPGAEGPHLDALVAALDDRAARRAAERGLVGLARAGVPVAAALRARLAPAGPAGADSAAARALARVQAGGPLLLPEAR